MTFVQIDELDKFAVSLKHQYIQLQPHKSTENILVQWLRCLAVKQVTWVPSLIKSLIFRPINVIFSNVSN